MGWKQFRIEIVDRCARFVLSMFAINLPSGDDVSGEEGVVVPIGY
jgi:hypothetical protein